MNLSIVANGTAGTAALAALPNVTLSNIETMNIVSAVDTTADVSSYTGLTNLNITQSEGDFVLTAADTVDVTASGTKAETNITTAKSVTVTQDMNVDSGVGTNSMLTVDDAGDVTITANKSLNYTTGTTDSGIEVGQATAVTGAVNITATGDALKGNDNGVILDDIAVKGGTTVSVTQVAAASYGDSATKNAGGNDKVTQGDVAITATDDTTTVTVKQDAAVAIANAANTTGAVTESTSVKFGALKTGDTLTIDDNGDGTAAGTELKITAVKDMTAAEVAAAFANLVNDAAKGTLPAGDTQGTAAYTMATYAGDEAKWTASAATDDTVVFTSNTSNFNVTDLAFIKTGTAVAPILTKTQGKANDATPAGGVTGIVDGTVTIANGTAMTSVTVDGFSTAGSSITGTNTVLDTLNLSNGGAFTTSNAADTLALTLEGINGNYTQTAGAATLNVTSTGANTADLDIATVETLTIDGTGVITSNGGVSNISAVKTMTVTGTAGINLGSAGATTALTSVDTTGTTGTVTMGIDDGTATSYAGGAGVDNLTIENAGTAITKSIDLGDGDDTLTLVGATVLAPTVDLVAGNGTDTLSIDAASAAVANLSADTAFSAKLDGFERLEITGATGNQTVNAAKLGFADYVTVAGVTVSGANGTLTLNDLAHTTNVVLTAAAAVGVTTVIKDAADATLGTADTLNFEISNDAGINAGTLTAADIETINVTATDVFVDSSVPANGKDNTDATHTLTLKADTATTLKVDGSAGLNLTLDAATVKLATIDASSMTDGGLTVTADGNNVMTITGGAGADVINASATKADIINGGAGADTLTAGFNGAHLTGGAGNDLFVVGATSATGNIQSNTYSYIEDFQAGDKIQLTYFDTDTDGAGTDATSPVAIDTFTKLAATLDESTSTFGEFVDTAFTEMTTEGDAVWFKYNGDSYIVVDSNISSNSYAAQTAFNNGEDLIVKVTGVDLTDASFNTDSGTIEIA